MAKFFFFYSNINIFARVLCFSGETMEEQKLKDPVDKVSLIKGKVTLLHLSFCS